MTILEVFILLIVTYVLVQFNTLAFSLYQKSKREKIEKDLDVLILTFNRVQLISNTFSAVLLFLLPIILLLLSSTFETKLIIALFGISIITSQDLLIFISHLRYLKNVKISYHKTDRKLILNSKSNQQIIFLEDGKTKCEMYKTRWFRLPAYDYEVMIFSNQENKIRVPSLIFNDYDFLHKYKFDSNTVVIEQQFNYLFRCK